MRRLGIPKEHMTGHGFRAMARTILDEVLGMRLDFIEHQLAHAVRDPNARAYNRTAFLKERKKMMQDWADYLDELKKNKSNVRIMMVIAFSKKTRHPRILRSKISGIQSIINKFTNIRWAGST